MSITVLIPRDQLERGYKGELDEAEKQLRQAKPHEVDEAALQASPAQLCFGGG
jgi:hypothetical protein